MTWPADTPPELRAIAERVLTTKQLDVVKLLAAGYSLRRIALLLGVSRSAVRERAEGAQRRMQAELDRMKESG